ncbi:CRISPR-associated helicase Cas3' [Shewanella insulae]|uniref:CRISPR-associated helicase Cas3' n=1 Tax=Shewanella insulae TaxID=2681496 RepID=UPI001EFE3BEE|nr:CRISPR-associated helicase Cas3' [Shewanella insulae]MCG9757325.1 CRISPR-associated helicase Cas3' [Shewanella insulae]
MVDNLVNTNESYYRYWGKTKKSSEPTGADYHLLVYHCLDVAAVGYQVLDEDNHLCRDLAELLSIDPKQLRQLFTFTLALHDLGKFAAAFQNLKAFPELGDKPCQTNYDACTARHDKLGFVIWHHLLIQGRVQLDDWFPNTDSIDCKDFFLSLFDFSFAHHGKPVEHDKRTAKKLNKYIGDEGLKAAEEFIRDIYALFPVEWQQLPINDADWLTRFKQASWYLSGLAVFCDWLGSDNQIFSYQTRTNPLDQYWLQALTQATRVLAKTDLFTPTQALPFDSIREQFGFAPSPLQQWAESVEISSPGQLFILEDITGAGKTEAALALTHRLIAANHADGFYFGLPTMATSNAMFGRVAEHYGKILSNKHGTVSLVLAHGARDMNDTFQQAKIAGYRQEANYASGDESTSLYCNQWLADSRKKALLAPVGVGTIDQPLLAILPSKHQTLRLLGLHRKILIFDEIHSADEYMFELLDDLLQLHIRQGGSAILLSATLAQKQRNRLVQAWHQGAGIALPAQPQSQRFPLATQVTLQGELTETPLQSRSELSREIGVQFIHSESDCLSEIMAAVEKGKCVVWIRNSVDDAYRAYQQVREQMENQGNCLLFHSRFVLGHRKAAENKVLDWFGKASTQTERAGKVLVSTQVFQESIDADLDLMISDICPIDDLIQRSGRLMRHTRNEYGAYQQGVKEHRPAPNLIIHAPEWQAEPASDWLIKQFRNTQVVYRSPGKLWLGMQKLRELGCIKMPDNARELIEAVYGDEANQNMPENLQGQHVVAAGEQRHKRHQAERLKLNWRAGFGPDSSDTWFDDDIEISTRYSDLEYQEVLVLVLEENHLRPIVQDARYSIQLSTVKLEKHNTVDCLAELPDKYLEQIERLQQQEPRVKYLKLWLPESDPLFGYCQLRGVFKKENPR